jgi:hypothetical protein
MMDFLDFAGSFADEQEQRVALGARQAGDVLVRYLSQVLRRRVGGIGAVEFAGMPGRNGL